MKNISKLEDFSHRKKSSPNGYEMIVEVLAAGGENKVYRTNHSALSRRFIKSAIAVCTGLLSNRTS
jgi:hypothetical protein